jgi:hypothetical protein
MRCPWRARSSAAVIPAGPEPMIAMCMMAILVGSY